MNKAIVITIFQWQTARQVFYIHACSYCEVEDILVKINNTDLIASYNFGARANLFHKLASISRGFIS